MSITTEELKDILDAAVRIAEVRPSGNLSSADAFYPGTFVHSLIDKLYENRNKIINEKAVDPIDLSCAENSDKGQAIDTLYKRDKGQSQWPSKQFTYDIAQDKALGYGDYYVYYVSQHITDIKVMVCTECTKVEAGRIAKLLNKYGMDGV